MDWITIKLLTNKSMVLNFIYRYLRAYVTNGSSRWVEVRLRTFRGHQVQIKNDLKGIVWHIKLKVSMSRVQPRGIPGSLSAKWKASERSSRNIWTGRSRWVEFSPRVNRGHWVQNQKVTQMISCNVSNERSRWVEFGFSVYRGHQLQNE